VSKSFYQKIDKNPKTDVFSVLLYHVFGRFSVRRVEKHDKKISQVVLANPGTFLASEEPTNHPKVRHILERCKLLQELIRKEGVYNHHSQLQLVDVCGR
jgi:hypothetical protein